MDPFCRKNFFPFSISSLPTAAHLSLLGSLGSLYAAMRDRRMDRIAVFPFSAGCVSESSVAIVESQLKRTQLEPPIPPNGGRRQSSSKSASLGLQKLLKRLKSFSRFFVPDEEEEEEDEVVEMEIGFPTDVQHVAHIGWDDGVSNMGGMKSWVRAPECLSLPSLSLKPFEVAMAAAQPGPLIRD